MKTIVCIPAFDEESIIDEIVSKCKEYSDMVIVCDDGSSDNTASKAKSAGAFIIKHEKNGGKGAAMKSLFKSALENNADIIVTIDGDGQFLPQEIPKLVKPIKEKRADIVIGYRFDDASQMPSYRKFGNKVLDSITNVASDLPFRDTQSGFRAYSRNAIEKIKFSSKGFGADAEILVDASKKGLKISEEKVTVIYETGGVTSTKHPIAHSAGVIATILELIAIKRPLTFLGIPGMILIGIGIIFGINVIYIFNASRTITVPSTLFALGGIILGLILLLMSVVLFSIGRTSKRY